MIEPKRRNTRLYFEHLAIEDRSKMTQRCDAKKGSYFYSVPKPVDHNAGLLLRAMSIHGSVKNKMISTETPATETRESRDTE
jgi:hypothetical protein